MTYAFAIERRRGSRDEDRASFFPTNRGFVAVVADGAGGMGGGAEAATTLCDLASRCAGEREVSWVTFLLDVDEHLSHSSSGGQTTAVIVEAVDGQLVGASVGDSGTLLFCGDEVIDLTAGQRRKPLIGSGMTTPVAFGPVPFNGRLLLASDGILKYVPFAKLSQVVKTGSLHSAALNLIDAAKLPNGEWHDDVAVVLSDSF
jgi:PPM family protein phosphatase